MNTEKLRAAAAALDRKAEDLERPGQDNTPKRAAQAACRRIDAGNHRRAAAAGRALAAALDAGTAPADLAAARQLTQAGLLSMTRTRVDHPSYYSYVDTGEPYDTAPVAVALRQLTEAGADPAAAAERARAARVANLEADIRFRPIPGFFPTPPAVVARMMDLANVHENHNVLEPSAGKGDIAEAIRAAGPEPVLCEIVPSLLDILGAKGFTKLVSGDFLERFSVFDPVDGVGHVEPHMAQFDRVVMNPPFENGQDIDHVRHAYKLLKDGGRLVSVVSSGAMYRQDKKAQAFRSWVELEAEVEELPDGAFQSAFRPTGVKALLVTIDKPDDEPVPINGGLYS